MSDPTYSTEAMLQALSSYSIDLTVVGSRGLGFKKLRIGSVSAVAVNHAHC